MPTEKAHGVQIAKMCEAFSDSGASVELIVPQRKNKLKEDPYAYYGVKNNFKISYLFCLDFLEFTDGKEFFSLIAYWLQLGTFTLGVIFENLFSSRSSTTIFTREPIIAFILSILGFDVVFEAHRILARKKLFFGVLKFTKKIITNSQGVANEFKANGFAQVLPVSNGIDLDEFVVNESKENLRQELHIPLDKKIALYSGHLYGWKGVDTVVKTASIINDPSIFFYIVGGNPYDVKAYKEMADKMQLKNIEFIGQKDRRIIPKYLKTADVLLLPNSAISEESVKYTSPIKLFEYMASGIPVVSSDLPSLREILDETNSVLVPADNPQALGDGIKKVLNDSSLSRSISEKAYENVKERTWKKRAEKILDFI